MAALPELIASAMADLPYPMLTARISSTDTMPYNSGGIVSSETVRLATAAGSPPYYIKNRIRLLDVQATSGTAFYLHIWDQEGTFPAGVFTPQTQPTPVAPYHWVVPIGVSTVSQVIPLNLDCSMLADCATVGFTFMLSSNYTTYAPMVAPLNGATIHFTVAQTN